MSLKRTGAMRNGPFRLDLPTPEEVPHDTNMRWLWDMVESRRRDGVPAHGHVMPGEEAQFRNILATSLVATREALQSAILE